MAYIRSDQETVLKEGMFEDLSLANKQLRFVLIFLMVCLLLNWREMVRQLLNQLKVLVDECKRTFQVVFVLGQHFPPSICTGMTAF